MRRSRFNHHWRAAMSAVLAAGYIVAMPAPTVAADEGLTGAIGDWLLSVCEGGLYQQGGTGIFMPGASNGIRCTSRRAVAGGNYMVLAGYYSTDASVDQDLALNRGGNRLGPYARGWDPSSQRFVMFALRSTDPAKALVPLERFSFAVSTAKPTPTAAAPTQLSPAALGPNEQQFIDELAAVGITPTQSAVSLAGLGWGICGDLFLGRTQEFETNRVYAHNPALGGNGARAVVQAAVDILCTEAAVRHNPPPYPPKFNIP